MNSPEELNRRLRHELDERGRAHLLRGRVEYRPIDSTHVEAAGRVFVGFSSNNYLGLTHHPRVIAAVCEAVKADGVGSGAAGLITGHSPRHASAERALATLKGTESAVLLPSGYQANLAAVSAVSEVTKLHKGGARFLVDKLVHASLIDAVRTSQMPFRVYPHNGMTKLTRLLNEADDEQLQVVVTESIFSMDGDRADLSTLAQLKRSRPFLLLLDEAHATGVYGPHGAGLAAEMKLQAIVDLSVVTLSKGLGASGGAVCASRAWCDAILNFARPYIYSTNVAPSVAAAVDAGIEVLRTEPHRQQRVRELAKRVRDRLGRMFEIPDGDSPIVPIILGAEARAIDASRALQDSGMIVVPVRPPTVAKNASRLRVTLSCDHTDEEVDRLIEAMEGIPRL